MVRSLAVKSPGVSHLRFRSLHAGSSGNGLQIRIAHREHDELARILVAELRGLQAFCSGALTLEILEIEERLAKSNPSIEVIEGRNHPRQRRWIRARGGKQGKKFVKAERRKSLRLYILLNPGVDVGQEFAQLLPTFAASYLCLVARE